MIAPVKYLGFQQGWGTIPSLHLFNLLEDIPGHPKGSTVSDVTLACLGYEIPREESPCPECFGTTGRHTPGCRWPE